MRCLDYVGFVEFMRLLSGVIPNNMARSHSFIIPDEIEVEYELDPQKFITDNYYINNYSISSNIIQSKDYKLTVTPGTWGYNDETTFYENISQIQVTFPDNSKLSKNVKLFYRQITEYEVPEGLRMTSGYIDTGLTMDGRYTFEATGYIYGTSTGVIVGAFENTTSRTVLRILPSSQKLQWMWYSNNEIMKTELVNAGVDIFSEFRYKQNSSSIQIYQNDELKLEKTYSNGNTTQTSTAPICIFAETNTGTNNNCVVRQVKIYDENNTLIRDMRAYRYNGQYVFKDFVSGDMYYPNSGELLLP